jgi:hypothetical protein
MKRLTKIIFVQWYLFDCQEIPIVGTTAVLGGNGAGKSSILDGVQVVLIGGDGSKVRLNKGSNERSDRSIREYCLGIVSDPNAPVKIPSRDRANTYIALCFYDDVANEYICAGLAIWATAAEPKADIRGAFITKGAPLSADDFTEQISEGLQSLPWERVKDRLLRRYVLGETLDLPNKGPGDFVRRFYTLMSAEPGMPVSAQTVVKSLLSAITFKPINDPTKFVRENMLDYDRINIRELSESLKFWRELRDKAVKTSMLIADLHHLERLCRSVEFIENEILHHEHASAAARIEMCYEQASPRQVELDEIEERVLTLEGAEAQLEKEKDDTLRKLGQKESDLKAEDVSQRIQHLEDEKNIKGKSLGQATATLNASRMECLKLAKLRDAGPNIPEALAKAAEKVLAEADVDGLLVTIWPRSPADFDALVEKTIKVSVKTMPDIDAQISTQWQQMIPLQQEIQELETQAAMLLNKQAPLGKKTRGLMELLAKNHIEATPLCDLIDVTDERWRATIEAVLGNAREALIVPSGKAKDAIGTFRYEGKAFRGAFVVNTAKSAEWGSLGRKGCLSELVKTDDHHARAFINLRLGNIVCVETEAEMIEQRRAATADLMLNSGGTVTMLDEVQFPILGRQNREALRERISRLIEAKAASLERLKQSKARLDDSIRAVKSFVDRYTNSGATHLDLAIERDALGARIGEIGNEIAQLKQKENTKLKQVVADLNAAADALIGNLKDTRILLAESRENRGRLKNYIDEQYRTAKIFEEARATIEQNPLLDPATASDILEKLRDKFAESENVYQAVINHIDRHLVSRRNNRDGTKEKVVAGLQEFLGKTSAQAILLGGTDGLTFETFEQRSKFILTEKVRLEETTLAEYETKAENALKEVEVTFRSKFISRLVERLGTVRENITGLNKILKHRPFHGEIYQFKCVPNPELEKVLKFAKAVEEDRSSQSIGGLFDPANDPDSPHREAIEFINKAFQDDDFAKLVSDYRNYYVFDVEMSDRDGNRVANLKHRIAKGSGGENMAPFYVAIGSSLSAAYRIVKRPDGTVLGGMNLAPFDEAFSKLDAANCYNCLEFLKDTGLQVLLAAPDEKYTTLAAQVDTVVWVNRDGADVEIETEFLTARTHELLRSDNPFFTKGKDGEEVQSQPVVPARSVAGGA